MAKKDMEIGRWYKNNGYIYQVIAWDIVDGSRTRMHVNYIMGSAVMFNTYWTNADYWGPSIQSVSDSEVLKAVESVAMHTGNKEKLLALLNIDGVYPIF